MTKKAEPISQTGNGRVAKNRQPGGLISKGRLAVCVLIAFLATSASAKMTLVAKWGRFEQSFKSSFRYDNPFQQCELTVVFVSPTGETNTVLGFWDGGRTWRVRFSPDLPGRWTYRTYCTDPANTGLYNQRGEFICTSPTGQDRFEQHGPVRVSRDHFHFEHADGTPFFWLADVAWDAPRLAGSRDWVNYTQTRGGQKYSAVEWAVTPGMDAWKHSPYSGDEKIAIDPEYFQRLDQKVEMMNRAGLLSVIAPLRGVATDNLPEDQAALLIRYMVARWGAYDVAWLLITGDTEVRWRHIGRAAFGTMAHAPTIVFTGEISTGSDDYRGEKWVDAFGFGLGQNLEDDALKWLAAGPLREWHDQPQRPFINVDPPMENGLSIGSHQRINADDCRRLAWWSLLLVPTAGTSYGAQDVADWNTKTQSRMPTWQLSLFLPGAKQMGHIADFFATNNFPDLRPAPGSVAVQQGNVSPRRYMAAAQTESKDLELTYVPEDRTLELYLEALSPSPGIQWFNPRTGQMTAAVAVVGNRTCQFPTPDVGDWLLVIRGGK